MRKAILLLKSALCALTSFAATTSAAADTSQILYQAGSQPAFKGPAEYFTGDVEVQMLFPENSTAHYSGAYVTFQPGARTAWHTHPAGQHMHVVKGQAQTGTRDGTVMTFDEGDTIWCPPDIDHWHGAAGETPMTHLVITGSKDGHNVFWKELVDEKAGK